MQQTNRKNYNKDQGNLRAKKYRETHRELCLDRSRQWRKNNLAYDAFRRKLYQQRKAKQTPLWADIDAIKQIYLDRPDGYHVDHIIPLHGETVCGLHVENNLQYLTQHENCKKGNRYG